MGKRGVCDPKQNLSETWFVQRSENPIWVPRPKSNQWLTGEVSESLIGLPLSAAILNPVILALGPGQLLGEGGKEVEEGVGNDHVVVDADQGGDHHHGIPNSWKIQSTKWSVAWLSGRENERFRSDDVEENCIHNSWKYTSLTDGSRFEFWGSCTNKNAGGTSTPRPRQQLLKAYWFAYFYLFVSAVWWFPCREFIYLS